jgi:hypothetical protein
VIAISTIVVLYTSISDLLAHLANNSSIRLIGNFYSITSNFKIRFN